MFNFKRLYLVVITLILIAGQQAVQALSNIGEQRTLVVLAEGENEPTGYDESSFRLSTDDVRERFFGNTGRSVKDYYNEVTYGKASITGQVINLIDSSNRVQNRLAACTNINGGIRLKDLTEEVLAKVSNQVDITEIDRLVVVVPGTGGRSSATSGPDLSSDCLSGPGVAGFTQIALREFEVNGQILNMTSTVIKSGLSKEAFDKDETAEHELGHNFGYQHTGVHICGVANLATQRSSCTINSTGNKFNLMGSSNKYHFSAAEKFENQWLDNSNIKKILVDETINQSFKLAPLELPSTDLQGIIIERSANNPNEVYSIEYRQPIGFDKPVNGAPKASNNENSNRLFDGAFVYFRNNLIDFTPCEYAPDKIDIDQIACTRGQSSLGRTFDSRLPVGAKFDDALRDIHITVVDRTSDALTVHVRKGITNEPALASFNFEIDKNIVRFTADASDNDGQIVKYLWDFGDGSRADGERVAHLYSSSSGSFDVTLRVIDDGGEVTKVTNTVSLNANVGISGSKTLIKTSPSVLVTELSTKFKFDSNNQVSNADITNYEWDFDGDGEFDFDANSSKSVQHIYKAPGDYTVKLRVTDSDGNKVNLSRDVTVQELLSIKIDGNQDLDQKINQLNKGRRSTTVSFEITNNSRKTLRRIKMASSGSFRKLVRFSPSSFSLRKGRSRTVKAKFRDTKTFLKLFPELESGEILDVPLKFSVQ